MTVAANVYILNNKSFSLSFGLSDFPTFGLKKYLCGEHRTHMSKLNKFKRFTVTSALPYANGPLHIGHLAGAYLPADIFVRYLRLKKKDVVYICGSDEHGAAITIKAKKENTTPQEIIDRYHKQIKDSFVEFGISFDFYHRTSAPIHHDLSQEFFLNLYEKDEFIEKFSEQYFDEEYQQFLADRYIIGTCPNCNYPNAYGDQCENCGTSLNPTDLINPISTLSGKPPVLKLTKHWYLPLDKYQPWLEKWIDAKEGEWKVNVFGQCKSWLKSGLQPRSMTRDLDWGIDVPLEEAKGKNCMCGWTRPSVTFLRPNNGQLITEKTGNYTGKNRKMKWTTPACCILLARITSCFTVLFSRLFCMRTANIFYRKTYRLTSFKI